MKFNNIEYIYNQGNEVTIGSYNRATILINEFHIITDLLNLGYDVLYYTQKDGEYDNFICSDAVIQNKGVNLSLMIKMYNTFGMSIDFVILTNMPYVDFMDYIKERSLSLHILSTKQTKIEIPLITEREVFLYRNWFQRGISTIRLSDNEQVIWVLNSIRVPTDKEIQESNIIKLYCVREEK